MKSTKVAEKRKKELEKECWDDISWAKKAVLDDHRKECVTPMRRVCKVAIKYDMLECAAISATFLANYYYTSQSHPSIGKKYDKIAKRYRELSYLEKELLADLQPLKHKLNSNYRLTAPVIEQLKTFVDHAEKCTKLGSPKLASHCYIPMIRYYEILGDFDKMKLLCEEAIEATTKTGRQHQYHYVSAQIALYEERYDDAHKFINKALKAVNQGTNTYCAYNLTSIKTDFYSGQYDQILPKLRPYKWKLASDKQFQEWYIIIKGYLYFLIPDQSFKLGKSMSEIYIFDRDKGGIELNLIIVYYLYYLRNDRAKLIDSEDAIDRYMRRHTEKAHLSFFKFLVSTIKFGFKNAVVELRLQKEIEHVRRSVTNVDIELVPYANLIDIILSELKD